jgi:hypothetical protein
MVVTQQYLAGELSILLSTVAVDQPGADELARLRRQAETSPPDQLAAVTVCALRLVDTLCWSSLSRGDIAAFSGFAELSYRLYEFGMCSGLLDEFADRRSINDSRP